MPWPRRRPARPGHGPRHRRPLRSRPRSAPRGGKCPPVLGVVRLDPPQAVEQLGPEGGPVRTGQLSDLQVRGESQVSVKGDLGRREGPPGLPLLGRPIAKPGRRAPFGPSRVNPISALCRPSSISPRSHNALAKSSPSCAVVRYSRRTREPPRPVPTAPASWRSGRIGPRLRPDRDTLGSDLGAPGPRPRLGQLVGPGRGLALPGPALRDLPVEDALQRSVVPPLDRRRERRVEGASMP